MMTGLDGSHLPPFSDMPHPYVSAHRGGTWIVPEGTRIGRLNAVGLGMTVVDGGDIHATADGVLYDCHDSTLDRTTNLSGPIADLSSMRVAQGKIDCSTWFGGGWSDQPITSIIDTLDDLGGRVYLTLEVKTDVDPRYAQKIVDLIAARGLTQQILIASFSEPLLAPAIEAGHEVMLLGTTCEDISERNDLLDKGIRYVGGSASSMWRAIAVTLRKKGLRPVTYSTVRHAQVNYYRLDGELHGYISDDPLYLKGHVEGTYDYRRATDPFDSLTYYHGHQADNNSVSPSSRGTFKADSGGAWFCAPVTMQRRAWLQGWASPLPDPTSYSISWEQDWTTDAGSAGGAMIFGCLDDAAYTGDNEPGGGKGGPAGYEAWFFSSGLMRLFRRDTGAVPSLIADVGYGKEIPTTVGTPTKLRLDVTSSNITLTHVASGTKITSTDTRYRGGYLHLLANDNGAAAGARWRNITISGQA